MKKYEDFHTVIALCFLSLFNSRLVYSGLSRFGAEACLIFEVSASAFNTSSKIYKKIIFKIPLKIRTTITEVHLLYTDTEPDMFLQTSDKIFATLLYR